MHYLLNTQTIEKYLRDKIDFFDKDEKLEISEIGDGNINYVFRIKGKDKSLVIKQSDKYLRSSGRPLDINRSMIESQALIIQNALSHGVAPRVYHYDEEMACIFMEDISSFKNLRTELMKKKIFPDLAKLISHFVADTTLPMTDLILDAKTKKDNQAFFVNPDLCDISEDLVFTEPYYDYKDRNVFDKDLADFVAKKLYNDEVLHGEVGILRYNFMNKGQSLIHGDLHSGSIFINETGIRVIDPEFAFFGPIGYDLGNVLGNLVFALMYNRYFEFDEEFDKYMISTIDTIYKEFENYLRDRFDEFVSLPLYTNEVFKNDFVFDIMGDALGYAGTEIIRRTVGDAKVAEITKLNNNEMNKKLINIGIELIKNRYDANIMEVIENNG